MNHMTRLLRSINPMNWSLQKVLIVGGVMWLVLTIIMIEPIARITILKKFYQDVALAARYSEELAFDHLVTRTQSSEGTASTRPRRGGGFKLNNCSSTGVYQNNVTGRTIHGAFTCSRNFISYYSIDNFDVQTISDARKKMISLGWTDVDTEFSVDDRFSSFQDQADGTVRGFSFKQGNGVNADMLFFVRGTEDYQSWCRNLREGCRAFEKADTSHRNIMVVDIAAYKGYED